MSAGRGATVRAIRDALVPEAVKARIRTLANEDEDTRELVATLGEPRIWWWAHSQGVVDDPVLETLAPPFPPRELRALAGEPDLEMFLSTGITDLDAVLAAWEAHAADTGGRKPAILDFGCGCGRLARFLLPCLGLADVQAVDVDEAMVAWCQAKLPGISARTITSPLPWGDGAFDFVYALSVIGKLPAPAVGRCLRELARVLRKDGILVATIEDAAAIEPAIRDAGFGIAEVRRKGLRGWQDVVVLDRRL